MPIASVSQYYWVADFRLLGFRTSSSPERSNFDEGEVAGVAVGEIAYLAVKATTVPARRIVPAVAMANIIFR